MKHVISTLLFALLFPAVALADESTDSEAKALFAAGREAFDTGHFETALDRWQEAYAFSLRPGLQYNLGLVHDRLRHDDQALAAFKAYLAQVPDAANRAEVESRIRALEQAKADREAAAPTPVQTAQAVQGTTVKNNVALTRSEPNKSISTPLTKQWWFWTGIGVVVAGGIVAGVAVASSGDKQGMPIESRTGITIMALGAQ